MPQLISVAANYPSTEFDTLIPELTDPADIREAFIAYHFGVSNFDGSTDTPAADSIHSHIESFKSQLSTIAASAVLTLSGTANQISTSGSAGYVTLTLPNSIITPGSLTITSGLIANGSVTANSSTILNGVTQAKVGINIFANAATRNAAITSPVEGTISYLQDINQQSIWSGSTWVGIEDHGTLGGRIDNTEVLALLGL